MKNDFEIVVLCGGISREREVSLVSGQMVHDGLLPGFPGRVRLRDVTGPRIPEGLDPARHVIFPALHGTFGEDGELQALLEDRGFAYAGSGVESSRFCMDKVAVLEASEKAGIAVPPGISFSVPPSPDPDVILKITGDNLIVKPRAEGSSVGLHFARGSEELRSLLGRLEAGDWLFERRIEGREVSVGVLDGRAMGVVEIIPGSGVYDYAHKYTSGLTEYRFPADIPDQLAGELRAASETVFELSGCRDFARVDFMLEGGTAIRILEVNTIPGLTPTSLLPKSASCLGIDYPELVRRMIDPALSRFAALTSTYVSS